MTQPIRIATRGSQLARWQARYVADHLGVPAEPVVITSRGDRERGVALQGRADQGFFTREVQAAVLDGAADVAAHSLKDLPTQRVDGLALAAIPPRGPVEDVLLVHPDHHAPGQTLPVRPGGRVGATSLRRQALLGHFAPDLRPEMLRGNVPTRIRRLQQGEFAAILLARAGLRRLGVPVDGFLAYGLDPARWIPAPGQAALGVEARAGGAVATLLGERLDHAATRRAVELERALMARFEAGCHAPFGAWATPEDDQLTVRVGCALEDGRWVAVRASDPDPGLALEAAWTALEAARRSPPDPLDVPGGPCEPLSSF